MGDVLGPDGPWPDHPGSREWNLTLALARERGWYLRMNSDHAWAHLYCTFGITERGPERQTLVCECVIYSSGRGTDSVAMDMRRKILRCPHRKNLPDAAKAANMARVAEALLDDASDLIQGLTEQKEASDQLDVPEEAGNDSDTTLTAIFELHEHGDSLAKGALEGARDAGLDPGEPPDPRVILDAALSTLREAQKIVKGLPSAEAKAVRAELKRLLNVHKQLTKTVKGLP